jgi:hypothetical protein
MSDVDVTPSNITTPNLGLNKPAVGGDDDIWGGLLNANADTLDAAVTDLRAEVSQLTGTLLFIGTYDVAADYAEFAAASGFPNGPLPPASAANFNSYLIATTAATGHGNAPAVAFNKGDWLVSDGAEWVHLALGTPPGGAIAASTVTVTPAVLGATNVQSALQQLDQTQANLLPLAGGQMTGAITTTLGNASVPALQIGDATAGFWALGNAMFVNAGSVTVMQLQAAAITADVPIDMGGHLVRNVNQPISGMDLANKDYVDNKVGGAAAGNIGRNLLHNGLFNIAQRGAGPFTTTIYTADRWLMAFIGGTLSTQIGAMADINRNEIGDEAAAYQLVATVAGGSGASDIAQIEQRIEGLRSTAGKTVTLSFWAAASSGAPKLGLVAFQIFGTGGSPSAPVLAVSQNVTLTNGYVRYTLTFAMPSVTGKTFGTTVGTDYVSLRFCLSAGATASANAGNIGVQSFQLLLWGVQLEIGSQATPLDYGGTPQQQLANCQRFYQFGTGTWGGYAIAGPNAAYVPLPYSVFMRANPTAVVTPSGGANYTSVTASANIGTITLQVSTTALGLVNFGYSYSVSADL